MDDQIMVGDIVNIDMSLPFTHFVTQYVVTGIRNTWYGTMYHLQGLIDGLLCADVFDPRDMSVCPKIITFDSNFRIWNWRYLD